MLHPVTGRFLGYEENQDNGRYDQIDDKKGGDLIGEKLLNKTG